jgi:hypothetical protein
MQSNFQSYSCSLFYRTGPCGLFYKSFTIIIYNRKDSMIIIYDRNDSGQYYKTLILDNLALAKNITYDCKLRS